MKMTEPGYQEDVIYKGTCSHCRAKFESEPNEIISTSFCDCSFCGAKRTVKMMTVKKRQLLHENGATIC